MIETLDPNLLLPPSPTPLTTEPVEPVEGESVSVQDNRLEEKKKSDEDELRKQRERNKKDKVELSGSEIADEQDVNSGQDQGAKEKNEHKIDIIIK